MAFLVIFTDTEAPPIAQNVTGNDTENVSGSKSQYAFCIKLSMVYHIKCFIDKKVHKKYTFL